MRDVSSFRKLIVWQKAVTLAARVYQLTARFPKDEKYGLSSQMQRAAVSIGSNIAEGSGRAGKKEFYHFLQIAQGSACELETQLEIAHQIGLVGDGHSEIENLVIEVKMMLTTLSHTLLR